MSSELDTLRLYFGEDYKINDYITVRHPILNDVIEIGELTYYSVVYTLTAIPSDMKSQLWDIGICWEDLSDFSLFAMLAQNLAPYQTSVFFGDLDFTKFKLGQHSENGDPVLYQPAKDGNLIVIDNAVYLKIAEFLRKIHNLKPKVEHAATKTVRDILIAEDRRKLAQQKKESKPSMLLPLVSSLINCSEFKYNLQDIRNMPLYAFMDSVARIQIIKSTTALLQGCYSGMIDTKKVNKKELNWMRDIPEN